MEIEPAVAIVRAQLRLIHDSYRDSVRDMDHAALNYRPGAETNSAAALVHHVAASESAIFNAVKERVGARDMAAEFQFTAESAADVLADLDAMDALIDEIGPTITAADLTEPRTRPAGTQPGLFWLIHAVGHGREHLGHVQLTKQIYEQRDEG